MRRDFEVLQPAEYEVVHPAVYRLSKRTKVKYYVVHTGPKIPFLLLQRGSNKEGPTTEGRKLKFVVKGPF